MNEAAFYLNNPYKMYCEKITPKKILHAEPIIMVTGVAHTSECYKVKPDGKPGWAYDFVNQGYEVILTDWPGVGKSKDVPFDKINGQFMVKALAELIQKINKKVILLAHSMSGPYAWKLGELLGDKISRIIAIAPGQMGNIQPAPEIIKRNGQLVDVQMPWGVLKIDMNKLIENDDIFVKEKLIGDSKLFPIEYAESYKASLQPRHPQLTFERLNIDNSQLRINNFEKLRNIKTLIVTGTNNKDHGREVDGEIADFLNNNGVKCDYLWLGDKGITGNGHMIMLEKNSNQISGLIGNWLKATS